MTTFLKVKNRAMSTLASGVNATATSWPLATGDGSKFPDSYPFHVTCEDEIVECTSKAGDTLTVTRAQEGTSPAPHVAGKEVELRITAAIVQQLQDHEPLTTGVHGVGASTIISAAQADQKITTHGTSAKHRWTLDKLRKGAGAGADPTEIDVPQGVPSGVICMWHGLLANIPAGWFLCDGNNGTPNLLAKFVEGVANASTDPGATGGSTSKNTQGHQHDTPISLWGGEVRWNISAPFGTGATRALNRTIPGTVDYENRPMAKNKSNNDTITDVRPLFYDIAYIMKA